MPGKVIGNTFPLGFPGTPTRTHDCVIAPFPYPATAEGNIRFGDPVAFDSATNSIRKIKSDDTADVVIGVAVRRIGQPKEDREDGFYYAPGEVVDVMLRGSIMINVKNADGLAPRGKVYVETATGDVHAKASAGRVAVSNAVFTGSGYDASSEAAEVTLLSRVI